MLPSAILPRGQSTPGLLCIFLQTCLPHFSTPYFLSTPQGNTLIDGNIGNRVQNFSATICFKAAIPFQSLNLSQEWKFMSIHAASYGHKHGQVKLLVKDAYLICPSRWGPLGDAFEKFIKDITGGKASFNSRRLQNPLFRACLPPQNAENPISVLPGFIFNSKCSPPFWHRPQDTKPTNSTTMKSTLCHKSWGTSVCIPLSHRYPRPMGSMCGTKGFQTLPPYHFLHSNHPKSA